MQCYPIFWCPPLVGAGRILQAANRPTNTLMAHSIYSIWTVPALPHCDTNISSRSTGYSASIFVQCKFMAGQTNALVCVVNNVLLVQRGPLGVPAKWEAPTVTCMARDNHLIPAAAVVAAAAAADRPRIRSIEVPAGVLETCDIHAHRLPPELADDQHRFIHFLLWAACKNTRPHAVQTKAGLARAVAVHGPLGAWLAQELAGTLDDRPWFGPNVPNEDIKETEQLPLLQTWAYHVAFATVQDGEYAGWQQPITGMVTLAMHLSAMQTVVPADIVDPDNVDPDVVAWGGGHDTNTILSAGVNPRGHYDGTFTGAPWVWGTTGVDGSAATLNKATTMHRGALTAAFTAGGDPATPRERRFPHDQPRVIHPLGNDPHAPATQSMCSILGTLSHEAALARMQTLTDHAELIGSLQKIDTRLEQWPLVCRKVGKELVASTKAVAGLSDFGPCTLMSQHLGMDAATITRAPCFDSVIWWPGFYPTALIVPDGVFECSTNTTGAADDAVVLVAEYKTKWRRGDDQHYLKQWPTSSGYENARQTLFEAAGVAMALVPRPDAKQHRIRAALIICEVDDSATTKPAAAHPSIKSLSTFTRSTAVLTQATLSNVRAQVNQQMEANRKYKFTPTALTKLEPPPKKPPPADGGGGGGGGAAAVPQLPQTREVFAIHVDTHLCDPNIEVVQTHNPAPKLNLVAPGTVKALQREDEVAVGELAAMAGWAWHPRVDNTLGEPEPHEPMQRPATWATLHYEALFFVYKMYDQSQYQTSVVHSGTQHSWTVPDSMAAALIVPIVGDLVTFAGGSVGMVNASAGGTFAVIRAAAHDLPQGAPGDLDGRRMPQGHAMVVVTARAGRIQWEAKYNRTMETATSLVDALGHSHALTNMQARTATVTWNARGELALLNGKLAFHANVGEAVRWSKLFPYRGGRWRNLTWWMCAVTSEVAGYPVDGDNEPCHGYNPPSTTRGWLLLDQWVSAPVPAPEDRMVVELARPDVLRQLIKVCPTTRTGERRCTWEYIKLPAPERTKVHGPNDPKQAPHYFSYDDDMADACGFGLIMVAPKEIFRSNVNNSATLCAVYCDAATPSANAGQPHLDVGLFRWKPKRVTSKLWEYATCAKLAFGWQDARNTGRLVSSAHEAARYLAPYRLFLTPTLPTLADVQLGSSVQWAGAEYAPPLPSSFDFPHFFRVGDDVESEWERADGTPVTYGGVVVAVTAATVAVHYTGDHEIFFYARQPWCYSTSPTLNNPFFKTYPAAGSIPIESKCREASNTWLTPALVATSKAAMAKNYPTYTALARTTPSGVPLKTRAAYFCISRLRRNLARDKDRWMAIVHTLANATNKQLTPRLEGRIQNAAEVDHGVIAEAWEFECECCADA
jgi:hypothetical protein